MKGFWKKTLMLGVGVPVGLFTASIAATYLIVSSAPNDEAWNHSKRLKQDNIIFKTIETNGIKLNVGESGPANGPIVMLLHGYPETGFLAWNEVIPYLTKAGYRVVFPDLRGFNTSDKPQGVANYALPVIADDVKGLIDHYGDKNKIKLVGHDWGALTAYWVAHKYPQNIEKMAILNTAHPIVFSQFLQSSVSQMIKSSYMSFFVMPKLPEFCFKRNDFRFGLGVLVQSSIKGHSFSADIVPKYKEAWSQPDTLTCMHNYYRALFSSHMKDQWVKFEKNPKINVPTLIFFGKRDTLIDMSLAKPSLDHCKEGSKFVMLENSTHWSPHDEPETISAELIKFFKNQ